MAFSFDTSQEDARGASFVPGSMLNGGIQVKHAVHRLPRLAATILGKSSTHGHTATTPFFPTMYQIQDARHAHTQQHFSRSSFCSRRRRNDVQRCKSEPNCYSITVSPTPSGISHRSVRNQPVHLVAQCVESSLAPNNYVLVDHQRFKRMYDEMQASWKPLLLSL